MNTVQLSIFTNNENIKEQLIAQLAEVGYDAFEEVENGLYAFISEGNFDAKVADRLVSSLALPYTTTVMEAQNWNQLWESSFEPVVIDQFCAIRASFHPAISDVEYEIIITPKMSFGTGHHATTYLMVSELQKINCKGKRVADFGTGTGILAIVAEKLGAREIWAVDNDDWSIENARENVENNGCTKIQVEKSNEFYTTEKFDVILANINKNVILEWADNLVNGLNTNGVLLLSGLLVEDRNEVVDIFKALEMNVISVVEKKNWIAIQLVKEARA